MKTNNAMKKDDLKRIINSLDDVLSEVRFLFEKYEIKTDLIDAANDSIVDAMETLKTELVYHTNED